MTITTIGLLSQCLDLMWRAVEGEHARHGYGGSIKFCPNTHCREAVQLIEKADMLAVKL